MKTVYLAGKITGDPFYFTKFYDAKTKLEEAGFIVLSPTCLPKVGFTWDQYMRITAAMLEECEAVCFLPDWRESRGAAYEYGQAVAQRKEIFYFGEWLAAQETETAELPRQAGGAESERRAEEEEGAGGA